MDLIKEILYYYNEDGEEGYDFDEVKLLEKIDPDRVDKLKKLIFHNDKMIAYQAMIILVSWGIEEGFNKLNVFIDEKYDSHYEYEPHRIWGEDNVYDEIADAISISIINTNDEEKAISFYIKLLSLYHVKFFEGKLKQGLLDLNDFSTILKDLKQAINFTIKNDKFYQASQLLPILAICKDKELNSYVEKFNKLLKYDKRIQYNLDEINSLKHLNTLK